MRIALALVLSLIVLWTPAAAAPLAPKKASQLVRLRALGLPACNVGGGVSASTLEFADGTTAPYAVPAGQVLVVTGMSWALTGANPAESTTASVAIVVGGLQRTAFVDAALSDGTGFVSGKATIPDFAVKPGIEICVVPGSGAVSYATVYGFFTKDK